MPLLTINPDLSFFYNIFPVSDTGNDIDPEKPTVLLLHPPMFDHEFFIPQYTDKALTDRYNLIALDHHYHGQTEVTMDDDIYDFDKVSSDIIRFLDILGVQTVHIFGTNLGALIAIRIAMQRPDRVSSLALCPTLPPVENPEYIEEFRRLLHDSVKGDEGGPNVMPGDIVAAGRSLFFGTRQLPEDVRERWSVNYKFVPSNARLLRKVYSTTLDRRLPPVADWKKIKVPVLIAYGAEDKLYPPTVPQEVYDLVSEARRREIHCIPNGAHLFTWHQASTINPIFVEFLEKP